MPGRYRAIRLSAAGMEDEVPGVGLVPFMEFLLESWARFRGGDVSGSGWTWSAGGSGAALLVEGTHFLGTQGARIDGELVDPS